MVGLRTWVGAGALALGVGVTAACVPPRVVPPTQISVPGNCAPGSVNTIFETNPVPCMPSVDTGAQDGSRLDVVLAVSNVFDPLLQQEATKRCNAWLGTVIWQTYPGSTAQRLVCRTVSAYAYGVF